MNRKNVYFTFILLSAAFFSTAQTVSSTVIYEADNSIGNDSIVYYIPGKQLSWNDFQGSTQDRSEEVALSMTGFRYKMRIQTRDNKTDLTISVSCSFVKKDSWVKPGKNKPEILNHEQHHFDIAYIQANLFMKKLRTMKFANKAFPQQIEKVCDEVRQSMSDMQDLYDKETRHSLNKENQAKWDKKIGELLAGINNQ